MNSNVKLFIISLVILFLVLLEFFYLNPEGIKMGYYLSGGHKTTQTLNRTPAEIQRDYNEQVETYMLYKDEVNQTAQKWAETARQKANSLAKEYNNLMNDYILEEIGR